MSAAGLRHCFTPMQKSSVEPGQTAPRETKSEMFWVSEYSNFTVHVDVLYCYELNFILLLMKFFCRFGNIRENLIFANIREFIASRIQSH